MNYDNNKIMERMKVYDNLLNHELKRYRGIKHDGMVLIARPINLYSCVLHKITSIRDSGDILRIDGYYVYQTIEEGYDTPTGATCVACHTMLPKFMLEDLSHDEFKLRVNEFTRLQYINLINNFKSLEDDMIERCRQNIAVYDNLKDVIIEATTIKEVEKVEWSDINEL